uniref:6-phosphofructokinase n=1 Tax=Azospirillum argentinense TaxID=2970906 RepID=UPI003567A6CD
MTAGKRIGILTSGGDCAGLNAVIRAVVHRAVLTYGWQVLGIKEGTQGLLQRPVQYQVLDLPQVDGNMMRMGGTILAGRPVGFPVPRSATRCRTAIPSASRSTSNTPVTRSPFS